MERRTPVRIQADPELIKEFAVLVENSEHASVVRTEDLGPGAGLDFALETAAVLVAMASTLFFDKPIVPSLLKLLRRHEGARVVIETPTRTVTVTSSKELTEQELADVLAALARG